MDNNYASATIEALKLCVQEQHMIPMTLQFVEPTKHRPGAKNNAFLQKNWLVLVVTYQSGGLLDDWFRFKQHCETKY